MSGACLPVNGNLVVECWKVGVANFAVSTV
jgi:hypothetical protein